MHKVIVNSTPLIAFSKVGKLELDNESDVDIMILLDVPQKEIPNERSKTAEISSKLDVEFDYDILFAPIVESKDVFIKYQNAMPFFSNVMKEGRAVLALDHFDSKKHSGIIAQFRRKYMRNRIFPVEMSRMIDSAFEIRNASDYDDMFVANKNETKTQIKNAEYVLHEVMEYIGLPVGGYKKLFEEQGTDKNSYI